MLVLLPLITEAETNGKLFDFPSEELLKGVYEVTTKKKWIEKPASLGELYRWPRPIQGDVDIKLSAD